MNGRVDEDLIQRVLDGVAAPAEEKRLRDLMATAPAVRARYEEMERVFASLRDVRPVEPAPEHVAAVLHAVRELALHAPDRGAVTAEPSAWRGAIAAIRARLTPSLAYAFAAGAIAGVALFGAFDHRLRGDLNGASPGALLPSGRLETAGVVDTAPLEVNGFGGMVRTRVFDGARVAEIDCSSAADATIQVDYDTQGLAVLGFERSTASGLVALEPGRVRLAPQSGGRYRIWFEQAGSGSSDLAVQVVVGGSTLARVVRTVPEDL